MNNNIDNALISKAARDKYLTNFTDHGAFEALNRAKALIMAISPSHKKTRRYALTSEVAEYYGVAQRTIRTQVEKNKDEFTSDGVRVVTKAEAQALFGVGRNLRLTTSKLTIWTPRAMLRLGMLLRDSEVAKHIRSTVLDLIEQQLTSDKLTDSQAVEQAKASLIEADRQPIQLEMLIPVPRSAASNRMELLAEVEKEAGILEKLDRLTSSDRDRLADRIRKAG
jgi:hypothetical protein